MVQFKKLGISIVVFFCAYFLFFSIVQKTYMGKRLLNGFHNAINVRLSDIFDNTGLYAQALDRRPYTIPMQLKFVLEGAEPIKNYDTKFTFINIHSLNTQLELSKSSGQSQVNAQMHDYKFSFSHFLLYPLALLISLWIASFILFKSSWSTIVYSFLTIGALSIIRFICSLIYMRSRASGMEPFDISGFILSMSENVYLIQGVEFTTISTFVIFLIFASKKLSTYLSSLKT